MGVFIVTFTQHAKVPFGTFGAQGEVETVRWVTGRLPLEETIMFT